MCLLCSYVHMQHMQVTYTLTKSVAQMQMPFNMQEQADLLCCAYAALESQPAVWKCHSMPEANPTTQWQKQTDTPCAERATGTLLQQVPAPRTAGESQYHRGMALQASKPRFLQ